MQKEDLEALEVSDETAAVCCLGISNSRAAAVAAAIAAAMVEVSFQAAVQK